MRFVTREEIREIDRRAIHEFGIPVETLMENAGRAVADEAARLAAPGSRIVIVCGKGNNGGDGFVAARILQEREYRTGFFPVGFDPGGLSIPYLRMFYRQAEAAGVRRCRDVQGDLVIDALFGTGLTRSVEGEAARAIEAINQGEGKVLAVDVPSGLDANSGEPHGLAVRAEVTVTMGLPKAGFQRPGAREYTGEVKVAEIGFPAELL